MAEVNVQAVSTIGPDGQVAVKEAVIDFSNEYAKAAALIVPMYGHEAGAIKVAAFGEYQCKTRAIRKEPKDRVVAVRIMLVDNYHNKPFTAGTANQIAVLWARAEEIAEQVRAKVEELRAFSATAAQAQEADFFSATDKEARRRTEEAERRVNERIDGLIENDRKSFDGLLRHIDEINDHNHERFREIWEALKAHGIEGPAQSTRGQRDQDDES